MDVREAINKNPKTGLALFGVIVVLGLAFAISSLKSDTPTRVTKAFYSVDEGKTWFVDSADRIPPYDKDGKTAVRVKLFVCSNDNKQFVGYLERYSSAYKTRLDAGVAAIAAGKTPVLSLNSQEVQMNGVEVKRPGDSTWAPATDMIAKSKVTKVSCPSGGVLDSVVP